jgi:hypothetical protein
VVGGLTEGGQECSVSFVWKGRAAAEGLNRSQRRAEGGSWGGLGGGVCLCWRWRSPEQPRGPWAVCVAQLRGTPPPPPPSLPAENLELVRAGCCNLAKHIANARSWGVPVVVSGWGLWGL